MAGIPSSWAFGQDMSKHNGKYDPSVRPVSFVMQRLSAADGTGVYMDSRVNELYAECAPVPLMGGWHFWSGFQSLQKQVDTYLAAAQGKRYSWHALDWELGNMSGVIINPNTKLSADAAYEWIKAIRSATGKKVIMYIQRSDYATLKSTFKVSWLEDIELWVKYWPYKQYLTTLNTDYIWGLFNGKKPPFWQYGADAVGVAGYKEGRLWGSSSDSIDLDVFTGTPSELAAWCETSAPPLPQPKPAPTLEEQVSLLWAAHPELHP